MGATKIEFRLRMVIMVAIIALGAWAPWIEGFGIDRRIPLMELLALELSRLGLVPFAVATPVVIVLATLLAGVAAVLRIWGTAYLGPFTMRHAEMQAGAVMADGPYRYVRNPLYLGLWFMVAALAFLMPVTGALFAVVLVTVFLLRLILGEEIFLGGQLGESYQAYLRSVPRLLPRLRTGVKHEGHKPRWLHAVLSELNPIGVFFILAALSWRYDNRLMIRAIIVWYGFSLVVRALTPGIKQDTAQPG